MIVSPALNLDRSQILDSCVRKHHHLVFRQTTLLNGLTYMLQKQNNIFIRGSSHKFYDVKSTLETNSKDVKIVSIALFL